MDAPWGFLHKRHNFANWIANNYIGDIIGEQKMNRYIGASSGLCILTVCPQFISDSYERAIIIKSSGMCEKEININRMIIAL